MNGTAVVQLNASSVNPFELYTGGTNVPAGCYEVGCLRACSESDKLCSFLNESFHASAVFMLPSCCLPPFMLQVWYVTGCIRASFTQYGSDGRSNSGWCWGTGFVYLSDLEGIRLQPGSASCSMT